MIGQTATLTELDSVRADLMRHLLNEHGCRFIWQYDVVPIKDATAMALEDQNYDNIQTDIQGQQQGKRYALIGPGICDHPFTATQELQGLVRWLCLDGYLSCYARIVREP